MRSPSSPTSRSTPTDEIYVNIWPLLADPTLPIDRFREHIEIRDPLLLLEAQIVESRAYLRRNLLSLHRRLLIKVQMRNEVSFWIMLERMPISRRAVMRGLGVAPRNDRGQISSIVRDDWIKGFTMENKIVHSGSVTFGDLRVILQSMSDILVKYNLFSTNCWTFCSILQEELGWRADDYHYQFGAVVCGRMYIDARQRIRSRLSQLRWVQDPSQLGDLLERLALDPRLGVVSVDIGEAKDIVKNFASASSGGKDPNLVETVRLLGKMFDINSHALISFVPSEDIARLSLELIIQLRRLTKCATDAWLLPLSDALHMFGLYAFNFGAQERGEVISILKEACAIKYHLLLQNPSVGADNTSECHFCLAYILLATGLLEEGIEVGLKIIALEEQRQQPNHSTLVKTHEILSKAYQRKREYNQALQHSEKALTLEHSSMELEANASSRSRQGVLSSLNRVHGLNLMGLGRYQEAVEPMKQSVNWAQKNFSKTDYRQTLNLVRCLTEYSSLLGHLGEHDSCKSAAHEAVKWARLVYDRCGEGAAIELAEALVSCALAIALPKTRAGAAHEALIDALEMMDEAIGVFRGRYMSKQSSFWMEFSRGLIQRADILRFLEKHNDCIVCLDEAIQVARQGNPTPSNNQLVRALSRRARAFSDAGLHVEACDAYEESLEMTRRIYKRRPPEFLRQLHQDLVKYQISLYWCARFDEGDLIADEQEQVEEELERLRSETPIPDVDSCTGPSIVECEA